MTEGEVPAPQVRSRTPSTVLVTRLLGAAAALAAAILAVVGSFLPLVSGSLNRGDTVMVRISVTGWTLRGDSPSGTPVTTFGGAAQNGIPLTIAAALLLVVVLLMLVATPRSAPPVLRAAAVTGGAVVVAFFVGVLLTVGIQTGNLVSTFQPIGNAAGDRTVRTDVGLGAGFWLELVAGLLAVAAVVLAALPARRVPRHAQAPHRTAPPPAGDYPEQ